MTHIDTFDLLTWVQERHENCLRIAAQKIGQERYGWLEDAAYFAALCDVVRKSL